MLQEPRPPVDSAALLQFREAIGSYILSHAKPVYQVIII
jgi:hypothetical protein